MDKFLNRWVDECTKDRWTDRLVGKQHNIPTDRQVLMDFLTKLETDI